MFSKSSPSRFNLLNSDYTSLTAYLNFFELFAFIAFSIAASTYEVSPLIVFKTGLKAYIEAFSFSHPSPLTVEA
jgi:hypothetical protein